VPIPFQDVADLEALGAAAFLKIEPAGRGEGGGETSRLAGPGGVRGALFLINARGEPLEFAYNRVETPSTFLWRRSDLRRHAERRLAASLLTVCARTPQLLLCLAAEVGSELFCQDLRLALPVARIGHAMQAPAFAATEVEEAVEDAEDAESALPLHLFWFPEPPGAESTPRRLFQHLRTHGLLQEPFERAAVGLREVFDEGPR
jgi:hypothetical protein